MNRFRGHRVAAALCVLGAILLTPMSAAAQEGFNSLCPLLLQQTGVELEDLAVVVQNEQTRLAVDEEIFSLVDDLWQNDLIERLPYLSVKHRRDVAAVNVQQSKARHERQQASVDQYRHVCLTSSDTEESPEDSGTIEEARERYFAAECRLRSLDVSAFEIDLEYQQVLLDSQMNLRQNDIASRQQVAYAERDVALTTQQLELARRRVELCRR